MTKPWVHHTRPEVPHRGVSRTTSTDIGPHASVLVCFPRRLARRLNTLALVPSHQRWFVVLLTTGWGAMCIRHVKEEDSAYSDGSLPFSHLAMVFIASTDRVIHRSELYGWFKGSPHEGGTSTRTEALTFFTVAAQGQ